MKVKVRAALRKQWIKDFERWGITTCEVRLKGCWNNYALGFAHAKKSRHLAVSEFSIVILACNPCHRILDEDMTEEEMQEFVEFVILESGIQERIDLLGV